MGGMFGVVSGVQLCAGPVLRNRLSFPSGGRSAVEWLFMDRMGFSRAIHNIENSPFRTKFERDVEELEGTMGIGCISDSDPSLFSCSLTWAALPSLPWAR